MTDLDDRRAKALATETDRRKQAERLAQVAAAVFQTDDGHELLDHLCRRFGLQDRVFIPNDRGDINALRAAVRDGERAVVTYLIFLAVKGGLDFSPTPRKP